MPTKIQLRRDTAADWTSTNPTLAAGEIGFESDTNKFKIGDGATAWTSLAYAPGGYITASSSDTLTNKTIDANGTGNSISNIEVADLAASAVVTAAETIAANNNDTTIPTSAAVKAYADSVQGTITALNNQAENRLTTIGSTTTELDGEANLTFDGSTLSITGDVSATGNISTDAISLSDNRITTTRSNDRLTITANGTGEIMLGSNDTISSALTNSDYWLASGAHDRSINRLYTESLDLDSLNASADRRYLINDLAMLTLTGSGSGNSSERVRTYRGFKIDTAGFNTAYAQATKQSLSNLIIADVSNSSVTASTVPEILGLAGIAAIGEGGSNAGDITVTDLVGMSALPSMGAASGTTVSATNAYGQFVPGLETSGAGTSSATNFYGLYVGDQGKSSITNPYGVYISDADYQNTLGGITLQSGDISTPAINIHDNKIRAHRSNDDLLLDASGTGMIVSGGQSSDIAVNERYGHARYYYEEVDPTTQTTVDDQRRANHDQAEYKITASSANSNSRFRQTLSTTLDMNGFDLTATSSSYLSRGPQNGVFVAVDNTSGSSASTLANMQGIQAGIELYNTGGQGLTVNSAVGNSTYLNVRSGITVDNGYGYRTFLDNSGTVTNWYAYYAENLDPATNNYAFWTANAAHPSRMGAVILANQASDPSGLLDSAHIYAKDDAGSSEVYVRDEAGNVTKISPHNEQGEWEYYSVNKSTGKTVRVNMEKMIRKLEQLTGETFIENI